jgi:hypothetical protein
MPISKAGFEGAVLEAFLSIGVGDCGGAWRERASNPIWETQKSLMQVKRGPAACD